MMDAKGQQMGGSQLARYASLVLLLFVAMFATILNSAQAQTIVTSSSSSGNGYGKGGKPKPTPTPAPTATPAPSASPKAIDGRTDWNGTVSSDWSNGNNWTPNGGSPGSAPPVAGDVVWLSSAPTNKTIDLSSSASIAGLFFSETAASGYNITSSSSAIKLTLTASGATIGTEISDSTAVAIGAQNTSGVNTIDAPIVLGAAANTTQTIVQANGGTLNVGGAISQLNSGVGLNISGGTVIFNGTNSYTGTTTVNSGKLFVNGNESAATGAVTVNGSGTLLGGTGIIGGNVTVNAGAIIQAGSGSTGQILTVNGAVSLASANSIIQLALGGSNTHSTLAIASGGSITFQSLQQFTVIDLGVTSGSTFTGLITGVGADPGTESGWTITNESWAYTFSWDQANGGQIDLSVTAVPETGTYLAAILAAAVLAFSCRRRIRGLIGEPQGFGAR